MKNPPLALSIVTSVTPEYVPYLPDWAASLVALEAAPMAVGVAGHGMDDPAPLEAVARQLSGAGLPVTIEHHPQRLELGNARNRAIALAVAQGAEWVMHLDADDELMPHAVGDITELAPQADIVALGYTRTGDLRAGPSQRTKLYKSSAGGTLVNNPTPCSGVSPWRLRFWTGPSRVRYPMDQLGGQDTALWRQLGHAGARVVPTSRPCFWYRQHADSLFNSRRLSDWPGRRTGVQLRGWARGYRGVTVVVPRARDDGPERAAAWAWLRERYRRLFPDWELCEPLGEPGSRWCKGAVVATALREAQGRFLVLADADCVVDPAALREAVRLVEHGAPWVVPHRRVYRLAEHETARWLAGPVEAFRAPNSRPGDYARLPYTGFPGGGLVVVNRTLYEVCGGIPQSFLGWGAEDEALGVILDTMLGPHVRLDHPLIHLWHPSARRNSLRMDYRANRQLLAHYQRARGDRERMWALVQQGPRAHLAATDFTPAARYGSLTRARRIAIEEARMQDTFAHRRLEAARARQQAAGAGAVTTNHGEDHMAGARDVAIAHKRAREAQAKRNAEAVAAAERAKQEAAAAVKLPPGSRPSDARRRQAQKMGAGAEQNKMLGGAEQNKSGVTIDPGQRGEGQRTGHWAAGLQFASPEAAIRAVEEGLTPEDFKGRTAKGKDGGFTLAQVRGIVQHRGKGKAK